MEYRNSLMEALTAAIGSDDEQAALATLEDNKLFTFVYENIDDAVRAAQDNGEAALNVVFASIPPYESANLQNGVSYWGDRDFPHEVAPMDENVYYMTRESSGGLGGVVPIVFFDVTDSMSGSSFYSSYGCDCFSLLSEVIAQEYEQAGYQVSPCDNLAGICKKENPLAAILSRAVPSMNVTSFETAGGDYGMGFTIWL